MKNTELKARLNMLEEINRLKEENAELKNTIRLSEVAKSKLTNDAIILLEVVAIHSTNENCSNQARVLLETNDEARFNMISRGQGSFMSACLNGDVMRAIRLADSSNSRALKNLITDSISKI